MSDCKTKSGETENTHNECCPVEKAVREGHCPSEAISKLWKSAFLEAMKETQVDILKDKIRKAWGPMLEKEGDATIEAMGAQWSAMMTTAKAEKELREKFAKILMEGCK